MVTQRAELFSTLYTRGDALGEGGFGVVERGTRRGATTSLALKGVNKDQLSAKSLINMEKEVGIWSALQHHNSIVTCYGAYELHDRVVIVTELCEGVCPPLHTAHYSRMAHGYGPLTAQS